MTADRRSPLAGLAAVMAAGGSDQVRLSEQPFLAQVGVRLHRGTAGGVAAGASSASAEASASADAGAAAAAATLGFALPETPGTTASAGELSALWLGPDEWLVVGPPGSERRLEAELGEALAGGLGSVVDLSANRAALELRGPRAREVLERGCAIDLHPRAFGPGRCAQTLLARAQVILVGLDEEPAYRLLVRPSFGGYLVAWLLDAMAEFGSPPAASRSSAATRQRSVRATSLNV